MKRSGSKSITKSLYSGYTGKNTTSSASSGLRLPSTRYASKENMFIQNLASISSGDEGEANLLLQQEKDGDKEKYKPQMLQREVEDTSRDLRTRESETCNNDMFLYWVSCKEPGALDYWVSVSCRG